jgi:hypothetical protein
VFAQSVRPFPKQVPLHFIITMASIFCQGTHPRCRLYESSYSSGSFQMRQGTHALKPKHTCSKDPTRDTHLLIRTPCYDLPFSVVCCKLLQAFEPNSDLSKGHAGVLWIHPDLQKRGKRRGVKFRASSYQYVSGDVTSPGCSLIKRQTGQKPLCVKHNHFVSNITTLCHT